MRKLTGSVAECSPYSLANPATMRHGGAAALASGLYVESVVNTATQRQQWPIRHAAVGPDMATCLMPLALWAKGGARVSPVDQYI